MRGDDKTMPGGGRVCPASHGGWLAISLRGLVQNPEAILRGLIREGETVVDLGCGPGFFTLPMARMVGVTGRVVAVDLQEEMLAQMRRRAENAGLLPRITPQQCTADFIGRPGPADFALAFYMAHEVPDVTRFMGEVRGILKERGRFLLVEPKFHVTAGKFRKTVDIALEAGFRLLSEPKILMSRARLFERG
jgi:ubiquinone/menaquinone biosynthesis C-methylase UbiE